MRNSFLILIVCVIAAGLLGAANDRCCVVPQVGDPSTPVGAVCTFTQPNCNDNGGCNGEAWEVVSPGFCGIEEDKGCTGGAQTIVTVRRGHFLCSGNATTCGCAWVEDSPEVTENMQVTTCAGDGCS